MRLCAVCVQLPRYKFIRVRDALTTYGLKRGAVASLPKLKSTHIINYQLTYCMQVLRAIFQAEHQSCVTICSSELPNRMNYLIFQFSLLIISIAITHLARNKSSMNPQCLSFSLIAYLSRTFELKAGGFVEGLICNRCDEDSRRPQDSQNPKPRWVSLPLSPISKHTHLSIPHRFPAITPIYTTIWQNIILHSSNLSNKAGTISPRI